MSTSLSENTKQPTFLKLPHINSTNLKKTKCKLIFLQFNSNPTQPTHSKMSNKSKFMLKLIMKLLYQFFITQNFAIRKEIN